MAKIQCKMCGGNLKLPDGIYSGECPYCGSLMTFPKISGEQSETLYNRAEHLRRINDYDKAIQAYEKIIESTPDDPEAYWGLVLCRYGIEYVKDPATGERIPTCHRMSYDSILADVDYLTALEKSGNYERSIYEAEAERIAGIQKGILTISNNEAPFDVFICYKESDDYGKRTHDSVVAQEIYYKLIEAGYKVFFAKITLEEKIGQQYEPYIFAALNSAQAMLVIGSKKEYFEAVWVKNEWSRFLALMKKDRKKLLIPCYKDMDAYDIPEELSMFQAQDMSKIGFMQDILHGLKKVVKTPDNASTSENSPHSYGYNGQNDPKLRRIKILLEAGDFSSAFDYCEKILDEDPENGWAYFYKFLAEFQCFDENQFLIQQASSISSQDLNNFINLTLAARYANADADLKGRIDNLYRGTYYAEQQRNAANSSQYEQPIANTPETNKNIIYCQNCKQIMPIVSSHCPHCDAINEFGYKKRKRSTYALLALFLGGLGIHNIYAKRWGNFVCNLAFFVLLLFSEDYSNVLIVCRYIWIFIEICVVNKDGEGVPFKT